MKEKNYQCAYCKKKYKTLGVCFFKHQNKYHPGEKYRTKELRKLKLQWEESWKAVV